MFLSLGYGAPGRLPDPLLAEYAFARPYGRIVSQFKIAECDLKVKAVPLNRLSYYTDNGPPTDLCCSLIGWHLSRSVNCSVTWGSGLKSTCDWPFPRHCSVTLTT